MCLLERAKNKAIAICGGQEDTEEASKSRWAGKRAEYMQTVGSFAAAPIASFEAFPQLAVRLLSLFSFAQAFALCPFIFCFQNEGREGRMEGGGSKL